MTAPAFTTRGRRGTPADRKLAPAQDAIGKTVDRSTMLSQSKNRPAEFSDFDAWGRRLTCAGCGKKLRQPKEGRPRVICGAKECAAVRKRQRLEALELRWGRMDYLEALHLWGGCAYCGGLGDIQETTVGKRLVPCPACLSCRSGGIPPGRITAVDEWAARCSPGIPFPRPGS